jgi:hypothetical protein
MRRPSRLTSTICGPQLSGRAAAGCGLRAAVDDAADPHGAGLPGMQWVGDIELLELARTPAGDIEEPVVGAELEVGH